MEAIVEIVLTYLFYVLPWPTVFLLWVNEMHAWIVLLVWIVVGVTVSWLLRRFRQRTLFLVWFSIWWMPATIICGSSTLVPWALALVSFRGNGCATPMALVLCAVLNFSVVFGIAQIARVVRRRLAASVTAP